MIFYMLSEENQDQNFRLVLQKPQESLQATPIILIRFKFSI